MYNILPDDERQFVLERKKEPKRNLPGTPEGPRGTLSTFLLYKAVETNSPLQQSPVKYGNMGFIKFRQVPISTLSIIFV